MKTTHVTVKFPNGLHARTASRLVHLIRRFRSQVQLKRGAQLINGRSILNILLLAAACNTELDVVASGEDEDAAIEAVEVFFEQDGGNPNAVNVKAATFDSAPLDPAG